MRFEPGRRASFSPDGKYLAVASHEILAVFDCKKAKSLSTGGAKLFSVSPAHLVVLVGLASVDQANTDGGLS